MSNSSIFPNFENKYTQLMPEMTPEQFAELKEDIRHKAVIEPLQADDQNNGLDGRHRFKAWAELIEEGVDLPMPDIIRRKYESEDSKIDHVLSLNVKRRHLTAEQRTEVVFKLRAMGMTMTKIGEKLSVNTSTISRDLANLTEDEKKELEAAVIKSADGREFSSTYAPRVLIVTGEQSLARAQASVKGESAPIVKQDRLEELVKKWGVESGQLWYIPSKNLKGKQHRLLCGSVLEEARLQELMSNGTSHEPAKARLVVTSPPYNQDIGTFTPSGMQVENTAFVDRMAQAYADSKDERLYQDEQIEMFSLIAKYVTINASFFYNHKNRIRDGEVISPLSWIWRQTGWKLRLEIVWDRSSSITMNARMFIPCDERIYWLRRGPEFYFVNTTEVKAWTTVWRIGASNEENFSAPFPNEIPHRCIVACSEVGDIVLEPYNGTGTTMVEAERLSRICYGMEINPKYVAGALERLSNMGLEPTLAPF